MRLAASRVAAFLRRPDAGVWAVLVYGPDQGLARERSDALVAAIAGDPADPFRGVELSAASVKADPARLVDEAAALSFSGGRRVIRVRDAGDAVTGALRALLTEATGDALTVVEAGELGPRSPLRRLFEEAPNAAALPCYEDDEATLRGVISGALAGHGLTTTDEAAAFLLAALGGDRAVTRGELDKLALYMGDMGGPRTVTLDDVVACVGDRRSASLDRVAGAACDGDGRTLDEALAAVLAEGESPVAALRAVANHLQRLHLARGLVRQGQTPRQAMDALRPPVFFKLQPRFRERMERWSDGALAAALAVALDAEIDCKTTGAPAEVLAGCALMRIAWVAGGSGER